MTLDKFDIGVEVTIHDVVADDVSGASWKWKSFWEKQWPRAAAGEVRLLVARVDGVVVGRLGVDLTKAREHGAGILWAFDVVEPLRGKGIGSRLMHAAEQIVAEAGLSIAELASYKVNPDVTAMYERKGYSIVGEELDDWVETRPDGATIQHEEPCWTMRKVLPS